MNVKKTVVLLLSLAAMAIWAGTPISESAAAKPDGLVTIENILGSVTVEGWSKNEVAVSGTLGDKNEDLVFKVMNGRTRIEVKPLKHERYQERTDLVVKVPAGSTLEVEAVAADIEVKNVMGDIDLATVSGKVTLEGGSREVDAASVSGEVRVTSAAPEIRAASVSGSVLVQGDTVRRLEIETVSGKIGFEGALARNGLISAETVSGSITLTLPPDTSADVDMESFSGHLSSSFPGTPLMDESDHMGRELSFQLGTGDARIDAESFSGRVQVNTR